MGNHQSSSKSVVKKNETENRSEFFVWEWQNEIVGINMRMDEEEKSDGVYLDYQIAEFTRTRDN